MREGGYCSNGKLSFVLLPFLIFFLEREKRKILFEILFELIFSPNYLFSSPPPSFPLRFYRVHIASDDSDFSIRRNFYLALLSMKRTYVASINAPYV